MSSDQLRAHSLTCIRGDRRLFVDLSLTLSSGELLYLQGANGSGKTTLLRTLCGLFEPDEGHISWNNESTASLAEDFFQNLLYIGHQPAIKLELTPYENLRIICALEGFSAAEETIWQALEQVGLYGFEDLPCKMLSQGQKRRVSLARLFLSKAVLWILDEPFNALDVAAVEMLQQVISRHVEQGGLAVLTTHQEVPLTSAAIKHLRLGD